VPHIALPEGLPGILGPLVFRPETAKPLNELADVLLRGPSTLTPGERELIATVVSARNDCYFCQSIHGAVSAHYLGDDEQLVAEVKAHPDGAPVSGKLKALLQVAEKVQRGGKHVTNDDIEAARRQGATDLEIHDTVLIAAAFCMFNRYVDGLATWAPRKLDSYRERAPRLAQNGYSKSTQEVIAARAKEANAGPAGA
jgi:uncharacterized peroxidase-related enzyme